APENWPSKLELSSEEMCRIVDLIGRMDAPISSEKVDPKGLLIHVLGRYARTSHRDKIPNLESVLLSLWQDPTIHKIPSIPLFLGCALLHFLPVAHPQFPEILNTVAKDRSDCPSPDVLEKVLRIVICLPPNTLPVGRLPKDPSVLQYAIYRNNSQNPAPAKSIMLKLQKEITPALPLLYLAMIQDSQTTNIAISKIQFDQVITFSKSTKPELKTKSTTLLTNNFGTWAKFHPPIEWINHFNSLCREDLADVFSQVDHSVIISAIVKLDPESATATLLRIFSNPEIPKDAQNSFAELFVRHDRAKIKPLVVKLIQSIRDTAAIPACVIELGLTHLWEAGRFESVLSELNAIKTDHPAIVASFMPKIGRYFLNGIQSGKDDTRWVRPLFENHSGSITAYSPIDQEILALTFVLSNLPLPVAFQFGSISPALTELIKTIASSRHPASEKCLVILAEIASRNPAKRDQFSDIATKVAKSGDPES
ncbi:hypothetical protein EBR96_09435, partial [bacterium]|nr:hypothetical protein [bacterium]